MGQQVYLSNQYGQPFPVKVNAKDEKTITFDANHEMAGKELNFRIELVEVKSVSYTHLRGIRATFFTPGWVAEQYPDKLKAIVEKGHEIAALGYHHEHMALLSEEEQESAIKKGIQAIEKVCGVTPKGFRSPEGELTLDTLRIAKKNGLVYSSNLCDDDRPYWKDLGEDKILEIPIHWVNYDLPYFAFNYHPAFPAGQGLSLIHI